MIVETDFLDHWKTRMLVEQLDDPAAPVYLLRLWAYCQVRRRWIFSNLSSSALKALCHYPGHPSKLETCLVSSGFVRRDGLVLTVHDWDHYNAQLIASWNKVPKTPAQRQRDFRSRRKESNESNGCNESNESNGREEKRREDIHPADDGFQPDEKPPDPAPKKKPKKPREEDSDEEEDARKEADREHRKELWAVLCRAFRLDPVTKPEKKRVGVMVSYLVRKHAAPWDVLERIDCHRKTWPNVKVTPESLVKHWDELAPDTGIQPPGDEVAKARRRLDQLKAIREGRSPV